MNHLRCDRYAKTSVLADWGKWVIPSANKPCPWWALSPDSSSPMSSAVALTSVWVCVCMDLEWIKENGRGTIQELLGISPIPGHISDTCWNLYSSGKNSS